jgi:hypothetical protein
MPKSVGFGVGCNYLWKRSFKVLFPGLKEIFFEIHISHFYSSSMKDVIGLIITARSILSEKQRLSLMV